jgi:hypothetical protein
MTRCGRCWRGRGVTEVATRFGVSRQSVYTWVGRYRAGGRVPAAADPSGVGTGAAWLGAGTQGGGAAAVAGGDLADPGPQRAGRPPAPPSSPPRLSALGARGADVAVADGHHGWGLAGRRPGDLGAAPGGPDRQRVQFTGRFAKPAGSRCCSNSSCGTTGAPTADQGPLADHHREGGAVPPDPPARTARARGAVRQPGTSPEGGGCPGGGLQPPAAPSGTGHGRPSIAVPSPPEQSRRAWPGRGP